MTLFLRTAYPAYEGILKNKVTIPLKIVQEHSIDGIVILARSFVKEPFEFTDAEKEIASLDTSLQLILVESLDPVMYNHVINCQSAKHIWDIIEIINEGT